MSGFASLGRRSAKSPTQESTAVRGHILGQILGCGYLMKKFVSQNQPLEVGQWCPARDSNPHTLRRQNLNLLRLPIPPAGPARRYSGIALGNEGISGEGRAAALRQSGSGFAHPGPFTSLSRRPLIGCHPGRSRAAAESRGPGTRPGQVGDPGSQIVAVLRPGMAAGTTDRLAACRGEVGRGVVHVQEQKGAGRQTTSSEGGSRMPAAWRPARF